MEQTEIVNETQEIETKIPENVTEAPEIVAEAQKNEAEWSVQEKKYTYREFKERLDNNLKQQAAGFVEAGYLLKIARDTDILYESGYRSLAEFAKSEYGFNADVVSRYVKINDQFSKDGYSPELDEKYRRFAYTKLVEMLNLPVDVIEEIPEEATREQIREVKKEYQEENRITDLEVMFEQRQDATECRNIFEEVMKEYVRKHRELFDRLAAVKSYEELLDILAPAGVAMLTARIAGRGKYMITIKGRDEDITVMNIRELSKEVYTGQQVLDSIGYLYGGKMLADVYPEEVKIAPAQLNERHDGSSTESNSKDESKKVRNAEENQQKAVSEADHTDKFRHKTETVDMEDHEIERAQMSTICYTCTRNTECEERSTMTTECRDYVDRNEACKTEEQRYEEEQAKIDRQTAKILREREYEEKMNRLPSDSKVIGTHEIKLAATFYDDVALGKKTFELRKNDRDYKVGDELVMKEFKFGKATGRIIRADIVYMLQEWTGLQEDYCILGIAVTSADK